MPCVHRSRTNAREDDQVIRPNARLTTNCRASISTIRHGLTLNETECWRPPTAALYKMASLGNHPSSTRFSRRKSRTCPFLGATVSRLGWADVIGIAESDMRHSAIGAVFLLALFSPSALAQ